MSDIHIRRFEDQDLPWLVERHATLYARDEGFDQSFGPLVAQILTDFCASHEPDCERGWIAERSGQRLGSIFCVRLNDDTAKLRLFFLVPEVRGAGLGKRLLARCVGFARDAGCRQMQLWTHESHTAACALYASTGWVLTDSKPVHSFGVDLVEQTWKLSL